MAGNEKSERRLAVAAGVTDRLREIEDLLALLHE
jgi:hypothetical protein